MTNLIGRIGEYSEISDAFWVDYLERKKGITVSWHHSSGFDLRPFMVVRRLTDWDKREDDCLRFAGIEIQQSEFVFSDSCEFYYHSLLEIANKLKEGTLLDADAERLDNHGLLKKDMLESVCPIRILSSKEQQWYLRKQREYDGFLIKLKGFCSASYITIVYLCLPDEVVKIVLEEGESNTIALFESTAGGGEGGALGLDELYREGWDWNISYVFSDRCHYDEAKGKHKLGYRVMESEFKWSEYLVKYVFKQFWHQDKTFYVCKEPTKDLEVVYGTDFCLAIDKSTAEDYFGIKMMKEMKQQLEKAEAKQAAWSEEYREYRREMDEEARKFERTMERIYEDRRQEALHMESLNEEERLEYLKEKYRSINESVAELGLKTKTIVEKPDDDND